MTRILYFTRDYTPHDLRYLVGLAQTEHRVYYLQLERRGHATEDRPLPPEVEIVQWVGGRAPARFRDGPRLLLDLRRLIRAVKPDLIQAGPLQRSAFLVALAGFRPLLSMSWGYDLLIDAKRDRWWEWATRYTLKRSAALLGDCDTIRQLAISYGMADERIVTFPWGVDIRHFVPASDRSMLTADQAVVGDQHPAVFTLLSTRGWEPIYGVETIARAFVLAARQLVECHGPELRLIMLGNGSQAAFLRRIFLDGGVKDQVIFPGQVSHADLPRYYRRADLYVSASHSDGTSISLLEAMACGRPVLVSDIPGNREWVSAPPIERDARVGAMPPSAPDRVLTENTGVGDEGRIGWLFPLDDANALAQAILQAVEQRHLLPEMGRAARRLVAERADWEKNFPQLFKAYDIALQ